MGWGLVADEQGEGACEQHGAEDAGQAHQAHQRTLHTTLHIRTDLLGDQRLRGWSGKAPQRADRNADQEHPTHAGETIDHETGDPAGQAEQQGATFAQTLDHRAHQATLHDHAEHADHGQHPRDFARSPLEAVVGKQHEHAGIDVVRQVGQQHHQRQAEHLRIALEQQDRAKGIGMRPVEARRAFFHGQGFGQHQPAVEEVEQREAGCEPERQAQVDFPQQPANQWSDDETQAEGRADHAERLGALLRRGDVRDVGVGRGEAGRGDAGNDPPHHQPRQ